MVRFFVTHRFAMTATLIALTSAPAPAQAQLFQGGLLNWLFPGRRAAQQTTYYPYTSWGTQAPTLGYGAAGTNPALGYYGGSYNSLYGGGLSATTAYSPLGASTCNTCPTTTYQPTYAPNYGCAAPAPYTAGYAPYTSYRTVWSQVPTTAYQPIPNTGVSQPCNTFTWQAQRVPYSSLRPTGDCAAPLASDWTPVGDVCFAAPTTSAPASTGCATCGYASGTDFAPNTTYAPSSGGTGWQTVTQGTSGYGTPSAANCPTCPSTQPTAYSGGASDWQPVNNSQGQPATDPPAAPSEADQQPELSAVPPYRQTNPYASHRPVIDTPSVGVGNGSGYAGAGYGATIHRQPLPSSESEAPAEWTTEAPAERPKYDYRPATPDVINGPDYNNYPTSSNRPPDLDAPENYLPADLPTRNQPALMPLPDRSLRRQQSIPDIRRPGLDSPQRTAERMTSPPYPTATPAPSAGQVGSSSTNSPPVSWGAVPISWTTQRPAADGSNRAAEQNAPRQLGSHAGRPLQPVGPTENRQSDGWGNHMVDPAVQPASAQENQVWDRSGWGPARN